MPDDKLGPEWLSQVDSIGNDPVRGTGLGAEWRASSARAAAAAAAGNEAAKRSNEQPGDEDDDDEQRVRVPLARAGGYERWQWGRILGNYLGAFLFFLIAPASPLPAFSALPPAGKRAERLFHPSYVCTSYVLSYTCAFRRLRIYVRVSPGLQ